MYTKANLRPRVVGIPTESELFPNPVQRQPGTFADVVRNVSGKFSKLFYGTDGKIYARAATGTKQSAVDIRGIPNNYGGMPAPQSVITANYRKEVVETYLGQTYQELSPPSPGQIIDETGLRNKAAGPWKQRPVSAINKIVLHQSDGVKNFRDLYRFHTDPSSGCGLFKWWPNGCPGASYHYAIDVDGTVHKANNDTDRTFSCPGANYNGIHVCFCGVFTPSSHRKIETAGPTAAQQQAFDWLMPYLLAMYNLPPESLCGHVNISANHPGCPGNMVLSWITEFQNKANDILLAKLSKEKTYSHTTDEDLPTEDELPYEDDGGVGLIMQVMDITVEEAMTLGAQGSGLTEGADCSIIIDNNSNSGPVIKRNSGDSRMSPVEECSVETVSQGAI